MKAKDRIAGRIRLNSGIVFWGTLMTVSIILLIYSLILIINRETPLFTKGHIAEECVVISSLINIVIGINYFLHNKMDLLSKQEETKPRRRKRRTD